MAFIAMAALVVRWVGVLLLGLASIGGQLIGSLLLDLHVPTHANGLAAATVIGVALSLVAIGVATAPGRRA